jgi:serine phosphatase RsbU (regulator of sigma subunit)
MLTIFAFFSVVSTLLVMCLAVALLNVVIRREAAYLMEERIRMFVDNRRIQDIRLRSNQMHACSGQTPGNSTVKRLSQVDQSARLNTPSRLTMLTRAGGEHPPSRLYATDFADIVDDRGNLGIPVLQALGQPECSTSLPQKTLLTGAVVEQLSREASVELASSKPELLSPYRLKEGLWGEIEANFIPGSHRPVPVVIVARNSQTGAPENWVVCQIRPTYSRTMADLSRMGLRRASWVSPFAGIAIALILVYSVGLFLATRLSQRIVTVIDALSKTSLRIAKGDFTGRVVVPELDQLGALAASFNEMTIALGKLREQERQHALLERDVVLAREVQQHLYPRVAPKLPGASLSGITAPARVVSGDLYDFFLLENGLIGLLCADVSGKGMSAALMMAHLQAVARNRLFNLAPTIPRPSPVSFVDMLNRDLRGRFGDNRYATLLYGEFDCTTRAFKYINAGHCPPILVTRENGTSQLLEGNVPVGLLAGVPFEEHQLTLPSASTLLVYTDGVTEAANSSGEEFGTERLVSFCESLPSNKSASFVCEYLLQTIEDWSSGAERSDDITALALSMD